MDAEQLSFNLDLPRSSLHQLWTPDEIYDRLDEMNVRRFVEDRRVERKSIRIQPKALAEVLSMWSNTQPHGGLIFVGVEDDGRIAGCEGLSQEHKNRLEHLTSLCEDARWACKEVAVKNEFGSEDYILAYRVSYRSDKVVSTSSGDSFIREGDKKIRISEALKRELQISKGEIHYELEKVNLSFPQDFDSNEMAKFCKAFYVNRRLYSERSREELLELAKLGKRSGGKFVPNLACALLFANDPREVTPGCRIRVIRYEGTFEKFGGEMNSVFSTFVDGNVSNILFRAKPVISSQLRSFQRFNSNGRISTHPEYPEEAWFEAVVNAVAHRSYNLKTQNIFVKIFDDRFVVESPGGFVPPTTAETVYDAHNPRNPYLMEAMMHLELTFCGYEGTRRMRQAMVTAQLPEPRFKQVEVTSHQVHVTLENDIQTRKNVVDRNVYAFVSEQKFSELSNDEKAVVNFLARKQEVNITTASLVVQRSWPTTAKVIASLVDQGIIEQSTKRGRKHDSTKTYRFREQAKEQ